MSQESTYNREEEMKKAKTFVEQTFNEEVADVKETAKKAIAFALDELMDIKSEYDQFLERVSHLKLYEVVLANPLQQQITSILEQADYMINKDYTQQELDQMPEHVFNQVVNIQTMRVELLKQIAKTYLSS